MAAKVSCFQTVSYSYVATKQTGSCSIDLSNQKILRGVKFCSLKAKASGNEPSTKKNSVICADCDGNDKVALGKPETEKLLKLDCSNRGEESNGAVPCSQCKGKGVNYIDHFNGKFKAGDSCWLCGGKKHMLCGNCNGAGFIGGFMTSSDT